MMHTLVLHEHIYTIRLIHNHIPQSFRCLRHHGYHLTLMNSKLLDEESDYHVLASRIENAVINFRIDYRKHFLRM